MSIKKISLVIAFFSLIVSFALINQGFKIQAAETIYTYQSAVYSNSWNVTAGQGYNNGGVSINGSYTAGTEATWTFGTINPTPETFEVFTSWSINPNRTNSAPYTLYHVNGVYTRQVNQELLANGNTGSANQWSDWRSLGIFVLDNKSRLVLTTVDNSSGQDFVVADSVRLVPLGGGAVSSSSNSSNNSSSNNLSISSSSNSNTLFVQNSLSSSSSSNSNSVNNSSRVAATGGGVSTPDGIIKVSSSSTNSKNNTTIRTGASE